jgi:hypothetical protein
MGGSAEAATGPNAAGSTGGRSPPAMALARRRGRWAGLLSWADQDLAPAGWHGRPSSSPWMRTGRGLALCRSGSHTEVSKARCGMARRQRCGSSSDSKSLVWSFLRRRRSLLDPSSHSAGCEYGTAKPMCRGIPRRHPMVRSPGRSARCQPRSPWKPRNRPLPPRPCPSLAEAGLPRSAELSNQAGVTSGAAEPASPGAVTAACVPRPRPDPTLGRWPESARRPGRGRYPAHRCRAW